MLSPKSNGMQVLLQKLLGIEIIIHFALYNKKRSVFRIPVSFMLRKVECLTQFMRYSYIEYITEKLTKMSILSRKSIRMQL